MEWYEEEVRALEYAQALAPPPTGAALFYGSSSFRLWETLEADLAPWPVVNRAFGGSTLAACAHFFPRLVPPVAPGSLLLYAGDNDLGDGQHPDAVIASLQRLLAYADAALGPLPLAFVAVKPSPARQALRPAIEQVNCAARAIIQARPAGHFIDIYYPMLRRDGQPCPTLFAADGLHLSPAGYRLWTHILRAYALPLFEP